MAKKKTKKPKLRIPIAPPQKSYRDKSKYDRKKERGKRWNEQIGR